MPWAAAGLAAASIASGALSASAQSSAASQEQQYLEQALQFQEGVYGTAKGNLQPYATTGQGALYGLSSLLGLGGRPGQPNTGLGAQQGFQDYTQTPGYQFGLQQGNLGANRALAAAGLTGSGAQAKALTQYNQGYASQGFNNYLSQLSSLAGMGEQAGASLGQIGTGVGSQVGTSAGGIGAAGAAGTIGSANSLTAGFGGALGALNSPANNNSPLAQLLGSLGSSSYGTPQNPDTWAGGAG